MEENQPENIPQNFDDLQPEAVPMQDLPKDQNPPELIIPEEEIKNLATPLDEIEGGQIRLCSHHGLELSLFCDSCEEPICKQCTLLGPHNTQLHRIVDIFEAYNARVAKLSHIINSKLISKRDHLISKTNTIDVKLDEIKSKEEKIERDIRMECGYILERLKNAEGNKLALLTHEMQIIQDELEEIKEVKQKMKDFCESEHLIPEFLAQSDVLNKNIERLLSKPLPENHDINPWDLPHELRSIREALDQSKVLEEALNFKKEVIWKLWREKIKAEKEAIAK